MTRTETTKFLGKLLTDTRLGGAGSHWASEVSIDPWTPKARRVDYIGIFASGESMLCVRNRKRHIHLL